MSTFWSLSQAVVVAPPAEQQVGKAAARPSSSHARHAPITGWPRPRQVFVRERARRDRDGAAAGPREARRLRVRQPPRPREQSSLFSTRTVLRPRHQPRRRGRDQQEVRGAAAGDGGAAGRRILRGRIALSNDKVDQLL